MATYTVTAQELIKTADKIRAKLNSTVALQWKSGKGYADAIAAIGSSTVSGSTVNNSGVDLTKKYQVTDTELTATANAIRAKTGNTAEIEWASGTGFESAVNEIVTLALEPFATTSDSNFVAMIQAAHAGTINLQTDAGWNVGDKRTISISAFTGGGDVSHAAQSIDIAISSFANYENCGCVLQFDFADALAAGNRMNSSNTNLGGYGISEMYKTTLPALVNALPAYLRGLLIVFSCKASAGNKSTTIKTVTGNKLALRSEVEVFGRTIYSAAGEGSQIPYYTTDANRVKKRGHSGSANFWWGRSPSANSTTSFCNLGVNDASLGFNANYTFGVAPFGCI